MPDKDLTQAEENPGGDDSRRSDLSVWSTLLGFLGIVVGLAAGLVLFISTYPFEGSGSTPIWQISAFDGIVIVLIGGLAYAFRKHSYFLRGILISAGLLFIVN